MNKTPSLILGICLILTGVLALTGGFILPLMGHSIAWAARFSWPLVVVSLGLFLSVLPLLLHKQRGFAALFIPGFPILTTGALLLVANTFSLWLLWEYLWPLEVLSVACGFLLAAIFMDVIWLLIPASVIGLTGLVLQFCALTGWWSAWSVLWTVEPLALGLALAIIGAKRRSSTLALVGILFCAFAGLSFIGMSTILFAGWRIFGLIGPMILIAAGAALLLLGGVRHPATPDPALR